MFNCRYQSSAKFEKMGYEDDFLRFLQNLISDVEKRIRRGHQRLALNNTQGNVRNIFENISSGRRDVAADYCVTGACGKPASTRGQLPPFTHAWWWRASSGFVIMEEFRVDRRTSWPHPSIFTGTPGPMSCPVPSSLLLIRHSAAVVARTFSVWGCAAKRHRDTCQNRTVLIPDFVARGGRVLSDLGIYSKTTPLWSTRTKHYSFYTFII